VLTGVVRRYALASALLDVPNDRSSHTLPTPRGGGLALVGTATAGVIAAHVAGLLDGRAAAALAGALPIALVGWLDDRVDVRPAARLLVQAVAACWALFWLGGMPFLRTGESAVALGPMGAVLAVLGLVWATNLYNFMDGVDGLAGGEAVTVGVAGAGAAIVAADASGAAAAAIVAAAAAGFLVWNWAPAKIFLGDVGSGTLGFVFGVLAVRSENVGALPVLGWTMLLGVFTVDATITLARRALRGERLHEGHRSHAYQRAARALGSHALVSLAVVGINVVVALITIPLVNTPRLLPASFGATVALLVVIYMLVERLNPMVPSSAARPSEPTAGAHVPESNRP
jgi:Fuc2NAc and GlcNAc transferase